MKKLLRIGLSVVVGLVVLVGAGYFWASRATAQSFGRSIASHEVDFPIPFPVDGVVAAEAEAGAAEGSMEAADEAPALSATELAIARGLHLVTARYACMDCHGEDFSGGVMMDAMPVAQAFGPNLTLGEGGVTADYTPADWDRAVRHGIGPGGRPLIMPSLDFQSMSDRELSDIIAYIRSRPAIDNETPPLRMGPIGKVLVARGAMGFSADQMGGHDAPHAVTPPPAVADGTFGRHLAGSCVGCHGPDFTGGVIPGDPSWAPAANLTTGNVEDWTLEEFTTLMREGVRPDGTSVLVPMTFVMPFAQKMTDVEIEALYLFLSSLPAKEPQG